MIQKILFSVFLEIELTRIMETVTKSNIYDIDIRIRTQGFVIVISGLQLKFLSELVNQFLVALFRDSIDLVLILQRSH